MTDENSGKGGSYVISADGERELVERTKQHDEASPEPPAPAEKAPQTKPAKAGISSPAAAADQPTAE